MKKTIVTGLAFLGICSSVFANILAFLDTPNDNPTAVNEVLHRDELRPMQVEYGSIMNMRIWPLNCSDVTNVFGPKLDRKPDHYALPLFVPHDVPVDLLPPKSDWQHMDYYAVGDIGYIQFYYLNGGGRGVAVLYLRTDDKFVPLHSTNDFPRRFEWEKAKLSLVEKWLDDHLPKMTDLGVVEVSSDTPSHVALGNGKTCIITTQIATTRIATQPIIPNDWFSMMLKLDSTNAIERDQSRIHESVSQPGQSIGFKMTGNFYRLTPKLKKP